MSVIAAPLIGQRQGPRGALHQPHAQMILQRQNLAADGRLALPLFRRHSREAAGFNRPNKGPDMFEDA